MLYRLNNFGFQIAKYAGNFKIRPAGITSPLSNVQKYFSTNKELRKQIVLKEKTLGVLAERIKYPPTNETGKNEWANAKTLYDQLKASITELRAQRKESTSEVGENPTERIEHKENKEIKLNLIELLKGYKRSFSGSQIEYGDGVRSRNREANCFIKDFKNLHELLNKMTPGIEKDECLRDILKVILEHDQFVLLQTIYYNPGLWDSRTNVKINEGLREFTLFALESIESEDILIETIENIAKATAGEDYWMKQCRLSGFYTYPYAKDPDLLEKATDKLINGDYDNQPQSQFSKDLSKAMSQAKGESDFRVEVVFVNMKDMKKRPSLSSLERAEYLIRCTKSSEDREIAKQKILDQILEDPYLATNEVEFALKVIPSMDSEETKDIYLKKFIDQLLIRNKEVSKLILCMSSPAKKEAARNFLETNVSKVTNHPYDKHKPEIKSLLKGLSETEKQEVIKSLSWTTWAQFKLLNLQ